MPIANLSIGLLPNNRPVLVRQLWFVLLPAAVVLLGGPLPRWWLRRGGRV